MIKEFKSLVENYHKAIHLKIALADIEFKFPDDCKYPNLSVKIDSFGLINPLEGRTVSTLPEIHLATYLGAEITYYDAVIIDDYFPNEDSPDHYVFRTHLYRLYNLRNEAKKNDQELLQQLYKTYSNGLYGKIAQGISERTMFNTREGGTKQLPKSSITNSYYASMTTGLIRAALSELLVAINELIDEGHNYKIISATTDGLLYGIDADHLSIDETLNTTSEKFKYNNIFDALCNGYKKFNLFEKVDPLLSKRLEKFPSLMLLKLSHEAWNDPHYIEIKHVANKVINIKTRGQIGLYEQDGKSITTLLAKAGHKVEGSQNDQATWLLNHYEDEKIEKYQFTTLSGIQDIINDNSTIEDIVSLPQERVISLDYDYKRYPINNHDTKPHKDINQFMKYRQSVDYLRRLGQRASINSVDFKYKRAQQNVRKTGSSKAYCARHILRAMLQEVKPFIKPTISYSALSILLREYGVTISKIKHAKGARFAPNMIQDTTSNRSHIRKILRLIGYKTENNYKEFLDLLLHKKISNPEEVSFLD